MTILIDTIRRILQANRLAVHQLMPPYQHLDKLDMELRSKLLGIEHAEEAMKRYFETLEPAAIYFMTDIFQCTYASLPLPQEQGILFCGPVLFEQISDEQFPELFASLSLNESFYAPIQTYYRQVPFMPSQSLFESLFTELAKSLYQCACKIIYTDAGFFDQWHSAYENCLRIPEHPFSSIELIENRYEIENVLINAVAAGNETAALELLSRFQNIYLPNRMPNNIRDLKDYTITLNTLMRKAAEHAGVHPIYIDTCSNSNISLLESLTSAAQCRSMQRKIVRGYCNIVQEHKLKNRSSIIRRIVAFIDTDLKADLSLKSLSEHLGVNASYLSGLFSKEMGMSLTDYVNNSRIRHAQTLLSNTAIPIKTIAYNCGFSDVQYFTRQFKKIVHMPPKAYRESASAVGKKEKLPT